MPRLSLLVSAAVLAAGSLTAQQPPAQQPPVQPPRAPQSQAPVFRGGANLVRVDVTVLDKHGMPLTDLKPGEFDVREDNIPQKIQTLKLIEATGAAPNDDTSLAIRSPEHAAVEAARDDIRVFVIFWDEYHIGQMVPAIRAKQALAQFVETSFGPTDLVALMDQLTPIDAIRFSRDRRALSDAVHQLKGREGIYIPARSAMEEAQMSRGNDVEVLRSQVTSSALDATISYLGGLKEGRKSILFVSQTIGRLSDDSPTATYDWLSKAVRNANANNVTIYTLDPRGLEMNLQHSDVLQALAADTGGRMFSSNFPASALSEMVRNASAFYLLGYASSQNPADGRFHKISVHVNRPGVEVKARSGYFAPSLNEMAAAAAKAAKEDAPPDIANALNSIVDAPHLPAPGDLWSGAAVGADGTPRVSVVWTPRTSGDGGTTVTIHATDDRGHVIFDGPLSGNRVDFAAPPGTVHIRRNLVDAAGSTTDKVDTTLEVPDFAHVPLALGTPAVYKASTPAELRRIQSDASVAPYAGREFARTDRVFIRVPALGTKASQATVSATLLGRHGAKLADLPIAHKGNAFELDLTMASIARGEYVIAIEATSGTDTSRTLVPFRVGAQQ